MEVKFNVDEKSGKIREFAISGDDLDSDVMEKVFKTIKEKLGSIESAGTRKASVMASDIADLSADKLTIKDRLRLFLRFEYRNSWFTSLDVKGRYEKQYGEEIKLSTVSTYLSRLHTEGFLERRGNRVEREYRIIEEPGEGMSVIDAGKSVIRER